MSMKLGMLLVMSMLFLGCFVWHCWPLEDGGEDRADGPVEIMLQTLEAKMNLTTDAHG